MHSSASFVELKAIFVALSLLVSMFWFCDGASMLPLESTRSGVRPNAPYQLKVDLVSLDYRIEVHWKFPPASQGQTNFTVEFVNCHNTSFCNGATSAFLLPFIPGKTDYVFQILAFELPFDDFPICNVTVTAENEFGRTGSDQFAVVEADIIRNILPTPDPPLSFLGSALDSKTIRAQWEGRPLWHAVESMNVDLWFTILYADRNISGNTVNAKLTDENSTLETFKTLSVKGYHVLLTDLKPYTVYFLWLAAIFHTSPEQRGGGVSTFVGPVAVRTLQGEPDPGPIIVGDYSEQLPHQPGKRNVTLTWKVPSIKEWKGAPASFKFHIKKQSNGSVSISKTVPIHGGAVPNSTVIPGLDSYTAYKIFMSMCNKKTCGGVGQYGIRALDMPRSTPRSSPSSLSTVSLVAIILSGVIVVGVLVFGYVVIRKRSIRRIPPLGPNFGEIAPITQMYNEPAPPPDNENYDAVFVSDPSTQRGSIALSTITRTVAAKDGSGCS
ncbi:uncharacterized protein LOC116618708 isoform X2 [Nematostella vectensis]|uniref:uncharacterized protein LOC116618708 isoform X2 n=1 Tax=Nematostella vectensis TaxID=45351 RepID=UPI00207775E9|nr:uncharacterized protein LOC116618708 isoform X2 [Nematostella vectensis]